MVNTFRIYEQLQASFPKEAAEALAHVLSEIVGQLERTVTREDFGELKQVVRDLGAAQQRTEQCVEELAQAQKRTEQTMHGGFQDIHKRFVAPLRHEL
jgi:exonuclease VII small subunit